MEIFLSTSRAHEEEFEGTLYEFVVKEGNRSTSEDFVFEICSTREVYVVNLEFLPVLVFFDCRWFTKEAHCWTEPMTTSFPAVIQVPRCVQRTK